jgi:tetratricopeptide (TPR) repeat protein
MRTPRSIRVALALAALAGCVQTGTSPEQPAVPQFSEAQLRQKAQEGLALGLRQYQQGEYEGALKNLSAALDYGLLSKSEQSAARKHRAFIHCISGRKQQCADEFRKALEIDPAFDLTAAEAGHPIWGPVYRNVRAQLAASVPEPAARTPRSPAEQALADGLAKYDAGEFDASLKLLQRGLKLGLADKADQLKAHKMSAFSHCLRHRLISCRNEFMKAFAIDPDFDLAPAEAGHPAWSKTFAGAKQRAKQAKSAKGAAKK